MNVNNIKMHHVLAALVYEYGEAEGRDIFEWYCRT